MGVTEEDLQEILPAIRRIATWKFRQTFGGNPAVQHLMEDCLQEAAIAGMRAANRHDPIEALIRHIKPRIEGAVMDFMRERNAGYTGRADRERGFLEPIRLDDSERMGEVASTEPSPEELALLSVNFNKLQHMMEALLTKRERSFIRRVIIEGQDIDKVARAYPVKYTSTEVDLIMKTAFRKMKFAIESGIPAERICKHCYQEQVHMTVKPSHGHKYPYRLCRKCSAQKEREYRKKNHDKPNMIRRRAMARVNTRVHRGLIEKPDRCSDCQVDCQPVPWHDDPKDKPLEFIWVCRECKARRLSEGCNPEGPGSDE